MLWALFSDWHRFLTQWKMLPVGWINNCYILWLVLSDACSLTMDPNTVHRNLYLSHNIVTDDEEEWPHPSHAERFTCWYQLTCTSGLMGRCYWEVDWSGLVSVGVTYRGIKRSGFSNDSRIGGNSKSWSLDCSATNYAAWHNNSVRIIDSPANSSHMDRVGVYLDWSAGTVSFYGVVFDTLTHIHTFQCSFTEPLYPVFRIRSEFTSGVYNSVSLREIDEEEED